MSVQIKCTIETGAKLPSYQTSGSSGADICAFIEDSIHLLPGARVLVRTGLKFEIPSGFEIQIRPRSGLALKHGITVLNSPGTIDSDYRGEVGIVLINLGQEVFSISNGDRIAQMVVSKTEQAAFSIVESLDSTVRGFGGYGSTGQ